MIEDLTIRRTVLTRAHILPIWSLVAAGVCFPAAPVGVRAIQPLYGPRGVSAEAVHQGTLGSCYFHAVVAALARVRPQMLRSMIQENPDGSYQVRFLDGRTENAYAEDIRYSREIGYDLSDGLWVAVLFRAYAQKVLRRALADAITQSDMMPLLKPYAVDFVAFNDSLVLAYDRAIRSQVDQRGNINRVGLEAKLKDLLAPVPISNDMKDSLLKLLDSAGFFNSLTEFIQHNGELFGAYRAVGQGGISEEVMETLAGTVRSIRTESESQVSGELSHAFQDRLPVVACSGGSRFSELLDAGRPLPAGAEVWYVNSHCYTVLDFDAKSGSVKLRNPWAHRPGPDGVFSIPLATFVPAFYQIVTSGPLPGHE